MLSTAPALNDVIHPIPSIPFDDKYNNPKGLGSGGEADCDRYDQIGTNTSVAVKTIRRLVGRTNPLHEANVLARLPKHDRITEIIEVYQPVSITTPLRIVLPCYSGGDFSVLHRKVQMFGLNFPEAFIWHIFLQAAEGLHHLHTNDTLPVLHRDLKPENMLFDLTPHGTLFDDVKIIDFGMSTTNMQPHESYRGTPSFQPPESPIASTAADVYAVGASIYFMMTGRLTVGQPPNDLVDNARHMWYVNAAREVSRVVDPNHTDFAADRQPLSHADASRATFDHPSPLPPKLYSPLLEHWMLRALDPNRDTRATTHELTSAMADDARRQIEFYQSWIPVSGKRPMCGFIYPPPPPMWRPEL